MEFCFLNAAPVLSVQSQTKRHLLYGCVMRMPSTSPVLPSSPSCASAATHKHTSPPQPLATKGNLLPFRIDSFAEKNETFSPSKWPGIQPGRQSGDSLPGHVTKTWGPRASNAAGRVWADGTLLACLQPANRRPHGQSLMSQHPSATKKARGSTMSPNKKRHVTESGERKEKKREKLVS